MIMNAYFSALIATALAFGFSLWYLLLFKGDKSDGYKELLRQLLPNLIASMLVFIALYFFFDRYGIKLQNSVTQVDALSEFQALEGKGAVDLKPQLDALKLEQSVLQKSIVELLDSKAKIKSGPELTQLDQQLRAVSEQLFQIDKRVGILEFFIKANNQVQLNQGQISGLQAEIKRLQDIISKNKESAKEILK
jgi:hypothetical protein